MMTFKNWTLSVSGLVARQYDNLSRRIDIEGPLPEGYTWQLLVQCGKNADTILLEPTETGVGAALTADNLSMPGEYYFQLRGILTADGVTKQHTNVVSSFVPESLTGLGIWPKVPAEFTQVESRILELYQHPPVPGSNGYWLVWDTGKNEYVESQLSLPDISVGPQGEMGPPGPAGKDGAAATVCIARADMLAYDALPTVTELEGSTSSARVYALGIPAGKPGAPGADGVSPAVTVTRNEADTGAVITVINADGSTTSVEVLDGADGGVISSVEDSPYELAATIEITEAVSIITQDFEKSYKELYIFFDKITASQSAQISINTLGSVNGFVGTTAYYQSSRIIHRSGIGMERQDASHSTYGFWMSGTITRRYDFGMDADIDHVTIYTSNPTTATMTGGTILVYGRV